MALPLNISELIHGKVVEWERLEFKEGWNPESILHSVCAFANDINNWGGGYIVIGITANDGIPQFPPKGLPLESLDRIQGQLVEICYKIQPNYLPITQPHTIDGKHILVIWCPAGDMRPYSCPSTFGDDGRRQYYIRSGSNSIIPKGDNQTRLIELTAKLPFDDRINQEAKLNDLDLGLIREFLQKVGSDLFEESTNMPFPDICKAMQIARGSVEAFRPLNVGLLFFNKAPHLFFQRAWIELAVHKDDTGRNYLSKTFKGPIHLQIQDCLAYLQNEVISEKIQKVMGQAERDEYINYPYNAVEEAVSNAVYHKSYAESKPIEIQVFPDKMEILSYPGPLPPVTNVDLKQRRVIARDYRNRRIGDFLKELKLTEGKATGFPLIIDEMKQNGNPEPIFYTDDDRTLFLVTLPCHLQAKVTKVVSKVTKDDIDRLFSEHTDIQHISLLLENDISVVLDYLRAKMSKSGSKIVSKSIDIIDLLIEDRSSEEILNHLGLSNQSKNKGRYILPLIENGIIEMTIPELPKNRNQKYRLTIKGQKISKI